MNYPIISFLMCSRVRTDLSNPKTRDILKFFRDATDKIYSGDRNTVEFLIKFDKDDIYAKKVVNNLKEYPFKIKTFFTERGAGLKSAHQHYTYLFNRIDKNSKFVGVCGDDAIFEHFSLDILYQLKQYINYNYVFFTSQQEMVTIENMQKVDDYQNKSKQIISDLGQYHLIEPYPIVSKKILEICGGYGCHHNIDSWLGLINLVLFHKYKILITEKLVRQTFLRENLQSLDVYNKDPFVNKDGSYTTTYNVDLEDSSYYYQLIMQQAKNIFLNIKEDGLLDYYSIKESGGVYV